MTEAVTGPAAAGGGAAAGAATRSGPLAAAGTLAVVVAVAVVVVGAAAGGALAGCHPTGLAAADAVETGALAGLVALAGAGSGPGALLVFAAVATGFGRGWPQALGALAVAVALVPVVWPRARLAARLPGAVAAALAVQAMLRWAPTGPHAMTAAVAAASSAVLGVSAYRRAAPRVRRWARRAALGVAGAAVVLSLPLLVASALSVSRVRQGASAAQQAFATVSQGRASAAVAPLRQAAADFGSAAADLGAWWTAPARLVPVAGQQRRALAQASVAASRLGTVAAGVAPSFDTSRLAYHDGAVDLAAVSAMAPPARALDNALATAQRAVAGAASPWLLAPVARELGRFDRQVARARASTSLAVTATARVPAMLGAQGPRHYVVVFMSLAESRGLGGIAGAYAELTADHGRITLTRSGSEGDLNLALPPAGAKLLGPANFLARYGTFTPGRFFQDVTLSPDLPTVGQVVAQMYPQAGGDHVDGVLCVDPYGLAALLRLSGPVSVPGLAQPITAATAVPFLLRGLYTLDGGSDAAQNAVLKDLLHTAFSHLVDGSLPSPAALSQTLEPAVLAGHIGLWSADGADAGLVQGLHLADAFPASGSSDLLSVATENAGANKLDAYLHQSVADDIAVNPATGQVHATVTVTLRSTVPASGLPATVVDSPLAPGTPRGADPLLVTVYTPYGLTGVTLDGKPATMSAGQELGTTAYRQWVTVPAGGTLRLVLDLTGATEPGVPYELRLHVPPAANPTAVRATFTAGGDRQTWVAGPQADQTHRFAWP